jgi:hypothetical protein
MKKLLSILSATLIITSSCTGVIACGNNKNDNSDTTDAEQENMLSGASYITKMILAGRHENLNYNVNELLTTLITPSKVQTKIPDMYTYNGVQFTPGKDLNNYLSYLAPSLQYFNGSQADIGVYASYVMGMYDDKYYQDFVQNTNSNGVQSMSFGDSIGLTGATSVTAKDENGRTQGLNTQGLMMGLLKDTPLLSKEEARRNLAWGVQDTGALTNLLLSKGYDGVSPFVGPTASKDFEAATMSYEKTLNYAGYMFYNSVTPVAANPSFIKTGIDSIKNSVGNKITDSNYTFVKVNKTNSRKTGGQLKRSDGTTINFGAIGADIMNYASDLNIYGTSTSFLNYFNAISNTHSGSLILSQLLNYMFPIIPAWGSEADVQHQASSLFVNPLASLFDADGVKTEVSDFLKNVIGTSLTESELSTSKATDKLIKNGKGQKEQVTIGELFKPSNALVDNASSSEKATAYKPAVDNAVNVLNKLIDGYTNANANVKKSFAEEFFKYKTGLLYKAFSSLWSQTGNKEDEWNKIMNATDNYSSGVNLLKLLSDSLSDVSKNANKIFEIYDNPYYANEANEFGGKALQDFTAKDTEDYLKLLGFNGTDVGEGTILDTALNRLTTKQTGYNELLDFLGSMTNKASAKMEEPHEKYFQYLFDDQYWKMSDVNISTNESSSLGATMEFTLDYSGKGDESSTADKQLRKVDVDRKFNPYQTIKENQKAIFDESIGKWAGAISYEDATAKLSDKKSGVVLGQEQYGLSDDDLISYDGTGMNLTDVSHKYKVKWANVSNDPSTPYWVIVDIQSFNSNGQEFYNLY